MIKLVEKKVEENKIYREICDTCGATFEFEKSDACVGECGCYYVDCPKCHSDVYTDEIEPIDITINNIEFPDHFSKFGKGREIGDGTIQAWIDGALKWFKENPNEPFYIHASGNARVIVLNFDDEYEVIVAKDYYVCDVTKNNKCKQIVNK